MPIERSRCFAAGRNNRDIQVRRRTALILTALPDEFRAVVKHLKKVGDGKAFDSISTHYFVGTFKAANREIWTVYVGSSGAGNIFAANLAAAAIKEFQPHVAILTGIAGTLDPKSLARVL